MNATPSTFEELEALCQRICHVLERENAILRSRNGLIGEGIEELEGIQSEKDSTIAQLERASKDDICIAESRRSPERAERVRTAIGRCKELQMRNHQIFSRVVTAQRKIISVLRQPEDDVNLYDRAGRSRDFGVAHRSELA
jgi:flagellar biosynthesis/type III secretory pathway chaperone